MSNDLELVFYGQLAEGFDTQQAKQNIAQLFKASVDQIERMFTGKRVVVRNKLDPDMALKYVVAMKKRGAICQIERMGAPGEKVDLSSKSSPVSEPPKQAQQTQSSASEPPKVAEPSTPPSVSSSPSAQPSEGGISLAGERVDQVLASVDFKLDPVGVRLSEHEDVEPPIFENLDAISIAPVGSDLTDKKEEVPVNVPDISHINLSE